jgi:hypothetical protein
MVGSSSFDPVKTANEEVSIYFVCDKAGVDYSSMYGSNSKLYCPFGGITHIDGGATRAFRIYDETNSAYCFACSKYFTPVGLYQDLTDLPWVEAAEALLEEYGWKPETVEERWERVSSPNGYDNSELPNALDKYCSRIEPEWALVQLDEPYRSAFDKCVRLASAVGDSSQAIKWLDATKKYMKEVIDAARS